MPTHDSIFDYLAQRFRALNEPEYSLSRILLDAERDGFEDIWEVKTSAIVNALRSRGLEVRHGVISLPHKGDEHFDPVATNYADFVKAAMAIVRASDAPVPAFQLVAQIGLSRAAVPMADMATYLRDAGLFHIPGVGYWRFAQWTMPDGRMIVKRIGSRRADELRQQFEAQGWPLLGKQVEEDTAGLVTSAWLSRYVHRKGIAGGLGGGLYVPRDLLTKDNPLPMTANVAQAFADLDEEQRINDKDHPRLFRIALRAERLGWAELKKSRTTAQNQRIQTMWVSWTPKGAEQLRKAVHKTADVF